MHIFYNGITFTAMELQAFHHDAVLDDSKTDFLFDRVFIQCTAMINGQMQPRWLADPPMSYAERSQSTELRHEEAARTRPPGLDDPGDAQPENTDGVKRTFGAFRDVTADLRPYAATAFAPGLDPPAFANENDRVLVLDPVPNAPILTERLIRARLLQPRGQLIVFSGTGEEHGELLLHSPGWGRHCDAKNGPLPSSLEVIQVHGEGATFIIRWSCETFVNEQFRTHKDDPLLSNRFRMRHVVGEDNFLQIQVEGQAIFDTGRLHTLAINPDTYRPALMLPIPLGFVRGNIVVDGMEGMNGVTYSYTDRQLPINFSAAPYVFAADISAEHKQYIDCSGDPVGAALGAWDTILNRKWLRAQNRAEKSSVSRPSPGVVNPNPQPPPLPSP